VSRKIFTLLTSYDEEISVGMKGEHNKKANKTTESSTNSARLQKLFRLKHRHGHSSLIGFF
jgi:hypothetical protein